MEYYLFHGLKLLPGLTIIPALSIKASSGVMDNHKKF